MGKQRYIPMPVVAPELLPRLTVILEVLAGEKTVSEGARVLKLSRNHFQTLLHQGLKELVAAITPKAAGRKGKPEAWTKLERELHKLERENRHLRERVETTERLLTVASGLLAGRVRTTGRQAHRRPERGSPHDEGSDSEPEPRRSWLLDGVEAMRRLGLSAVLAAAVAGVHPATLRRWRGRLKRCEPRVRVACTPPPALSPEVEARARQCVRALHGLIGAEALRRSVTGLSRRAAARIKAATLTEMERERRSRLTRVTITQPDVLRGLDAMHLRCTDGARYALFSADGAVPYRTSVTSGDRYDAKLVAQALETDIENNGAPLVYRLDRATAHEAPGARAVLEAHAVLVLHGPPHYPYFYGQLERQNREHRAWLAACPTRRREDIDECLAELLVGVNGIWKRRTLGWRTAAEIWQSRAPLSVDRQALREEVEDRTARLVRKLKRRRQPEDLAERLAIEQTLTAHGYLRQQYGGWC